MFAILSSGVIVLLGASWLVYDLVGPDEARRLATDGWERLQTAPPLAFFAVVFVSSFLPVPVSLLYAAAGTLYGITTTLIWIAPTAALANLLIHFICSSFLRPTLIRQVEKRGHAIPQLESQADQTLLITLVRITPGFPYFLQNWLLGLAGVELMRFLAITLVIHTFYASGFVILGRSAFEGELGMVVFAIALLVAVSIIARVVHGRIQATRANAQRNEG
jgi:uncharacterized membrane protein YdjX (TVP38/TMEM64 family)